MVGSALPEGFEKIGPTVGERVRFWRKVRGLSRRDLGNYSTIADLENGRTRKGTSLGDIAKALRLNLRYLKTGEGPPEADGPQHPAPASSHSDDWLFPDVPRTRITKLNRIELAYAQSKLLEALAEIEAERRKGRTA